MVYISEAKIMAKSRNKNEKTYRQLKKAHLWGLIVQIALFSVCATILLATAGTVIGSYILDSKLSTEYENIKYMAKLYEAGISKDDKNIVDLLTKEERDYVITDSDGKVIFCNGKNTVSEESADIRLSDYEEDITIYRDSEAGYIHVNPVTGGIALDIKEYREWINREEVDDEHDAISTMANAYIDLPVWMSIDVGNGEHFIGKAHFSAGKHDVQMVMGIVIAIVVLTALILTTMFVAGIKNIVKQKRMISLFFTDVTTDGHNWSWFVVKGEQLLRRGSTAKTDYAIINMFFVNYRNYCICHSVVEGEKLLCDIYKTIEKSLRKREICAHASSSNYSLLLAFSSETELKNRLGELIDKLAAIDTDHKLCFQMGVSHIEKEVDKNGRVVKRRDIDIESEYNKALAARDSLNATEESGIAFFDEKLIEEQKWIDKVQEKQQYALENEEFKVYYQPKYDPQSSTLRGAEALIRWDSKELGFVSPGRFIPIFEKNGFITEIDHYMIKHVAADQKAWLDMGYECVPVSVNVSRAHFIENDLAEQIRDMVDEIGTPHKYIEIELTESAFFDDKKAMLDTINKLKGMGFAVSMDDFGSGYSSLNSLKDMPLDVLKLDAEFFRGEAEDGRAQIVVSEAIKLGKCLNMRIVAEGVEVKEQVDFLAGEGCDMIQGYYFAKPMPKNEYEERMQKQ